MKTIHVASVPADSIFGTYTIDGKPNRMPLRACYLEPHAAAAFAAVSGSLVVSDMMRTAESSLQAVREKRGAKMPGYSGHNWGLSIDIDVRDSMERGRWATKKDLDLALEAVGWYCHRRDHRITPLREESHHFNFLGVGAKIGPKVGSTSGYLEARIVELHGPFEADAKEIQSCLASLKLYGGAIDGQIGPRSKEAIRAFKRTWGLADTPTLDAGAVRTLLFVSAERLIVPIPEVN